MTETMAPPPGPRSDPASISAAFAPESAAFARDPYRVYARLRALEVPHYYPDMNVWLLARYADVDRAARDPRMLRSLETLVPPDEIAAQQRLANWHDMPNHERFVQFSMLECDGERHRRLRMIVLQEFSKTFVERHRAMIQRYVDALLDRVMQAREIDFVDDLASHVPGHVIGNLLGVPDEDCPQLKIWIEQIVQYFDTGRTAQRKQLAEQATTDFYQYLCGQIADRERTPRNDLLSTLVAARRSGRLDETELISTSMLILGGGHGSTIDVLGTGMHALLTHPDQLEQLRRDPERIHSAVQEMFRFDSPLPFFHRFAGEDVEVMGVRYPRGTKFGLLYGSANRDPAQFDQPDRFDIARTPNRHVAFGRGAHLCLGNQLARLDMEIIFNSLLARVRRIEPGTGTPEFKHGLSARGLRTLPVTLTPA